MADEKEEEKTEMQELKEYISARLDVIEELLRNTADKGDVASISSMIERLAEFLRMPGLTPGGQPSNQVDDDELQVFIY